MLGIVALCATSLFVQSSVLTHEDKAVIEAAVDQKERSFHHRIVFVSTTSRSAEFVKLLKPEDKQLPYVSALIKRNSRSVFLDDYAPSWASLTASGEDAVGWFGNRSWLSQESYVDWISLPAYNNDHTVAAIFVSALVRDPSSGNRRLGGKSMILRLKKTAAGWQPDGSIGRVIAI